MHNYKSFTGQTNLVHFALLRFSAKIKVAHKWPGHVCDPRISLMQVDVLLENITGRTSHDVNARITHFTLADLAHSRPLSKYGEFPGLAAETQPAIG